LINLIAKKNFLSIFSLLPFFFWIYGITIFWLDN